jgi:hypothetical protein
MEGLFPMTQDFLKNHRKVNHNCQEKFKGDSSNGPEIANVNSHFFKVKKTKENQKEIPLFILKILFFISFSKQKMLPNCGKHTINK